MLLTLAAAVVGGALYRLRGGWLKDLAGIGSTQLCRAVWALPTAALIYWQGIGGAGPWWLLGALIVGVFLSLALIGHGAHMVYGPAYWRVSSPGRQLEAVTAYWLEALFGGLPWSPGWNERRTDLFNMVGMSAIGVVRNVIAIGMVAPFAPLPAILYAASGALHGPLYWLGWKITPDIRAAEILVGAVSWASIVLLFGRL